MELKRPARGLSEGTAQLLLRHSWPGNARELRNVIRQAVLLSQDLIQPEHLGGLGSPGVGAPSGGEPWPPGGNLSLREGREKAAAEADRRAIRWALQVTRGNKSQAARLLRTDFKTLHVKMRRFGISTREFRPS